MSITGIQIAAKFVAEGVEETEKAIKGVKTSADDASGDSGGGGVKGLLGHILGIATGTAAVAAIGVGFGALTGFISDSVGVAQQAQQSQALLKNALSDTGDISGQTVNGLQDMAEHLSTVTTYSKDTVEGVEQIAVRAKIPKGIFADTTKESLDMAAAMGISAPAAANILTKALDNPKNAAAQLRREHVNLTKAQEDAINADMKRGDSLAAQKVILDAVKGSMGGAAEAAGNTFAGKLTILQNQLENTKEKVGNAVLPILSQLMNAVMPLVTQFANNLPGALKIATDFFNKNVMPVVKSVAGVITNDVIPAVQTVAGKIGDFIGYLQTHQDAMDAFKAILAVVAIVIATALVAAFVMWAISAAAAAIATIAATWPILAIGLAIGLLIVGIKALIDHWGQITSALGKFKDGVAKDVGDAFSKMGSAVQAVWQGIQSGVKAGINLVIWDINGMIDMLDALQIHIPSVSVGPLSTPAFNWNGLQLHEIPYLAQGGTALEGGWSVVGEQGPEMRYLPAGASVVPLPAGMRDAMAGRPATDEPANIVLIVDGQRLARVLLPHQRSAIYNVTGVRGV